MPMTIDQIRAKTKRYVMRSKYKDAVRYLKKQLKDHPGNFVILSALATLPYEDAFGAGPKRRAEGMKKAAANLKPLLKKMRGQDGLARFRARNEYYWFSQQHKKQYDLGVEGVRRGMVRAYYSQGVGAANYAYKILRKGSSKRGLRWAKTAERAWLNYFAKFSRAYYDPWLWYGLALGLQGRAVEMERALKRGAKLGGISYLNYPAINRIRQMVAECRR